MEDTNSTFPFLYQDIYDHIFQYVNCPRIIKNSMLTNKSLLLATQNIRCLYGNISFKLLLQDNFAFPKLTHINGDIIIHHNEHSKDCVENRLLKLITSNNVKMFNINCVYTNKNDYRNNEDDLSTYSPIAHLLEKFCLFCEYKGKKYEQYKVTKIGNVIQLNSIENASYIEYGGIFKLIVGYEYHLVLNTGTDLFLYNGYMSDITNMNVSSIVLTSNTRYISLPDEIELWPSINTIIIDSQEAEYAFFFYQEGTYHQIRRITTNYDLIYSKKIQDSSYRIKRLIHATRCQYHNAKIEISVFRKELSSLNNDILYAPNVILKYIDKD